MNNIKSFLKTIFLSVIGLLIIGGLYPRQLNAQNTSDNDPSLYDGLYRPQYHFTPPKNWNNDPNGLVYYKGTYNLFYQKYPDAMHWGPMHWGHAVSTDLMHWKNLPIALYPDSIGYIFSGCAVVDEQNTAGFQKGKEKTLVAVFTQHNPKTNEQVQSIAYSTDKGKTWTKYATNPVIANPGERDFRDPSVHWYQPLHEWVLALAAGDHIEFYSSKNLKAWTKESDFGKGAGSHGGVWECPDLLSMKVNGSAEQKWVLTVNNGGSPAGSGGTQYFVGSFDGHQFEPQDTATRWLYGGADEYAGITWHNTGNRIIFIGWMNNWPAASDKVPSYTWRGGMTIPVSLQLEKEDGDYFLTKQPVKELDQLASPLISKNNITLTGNWEKSFNKNELASSVINISADIRRQQSIIISLQNKDGEHVDIGIDNKNHQFYIDRTKANGQYLQAESAKTHHVQLPDNLRNVELTILYDHSTLEVFLNKRWAMADLVVPTTLYDQLKVNSPGEGLKIKKLQASHLHSVWK